jgi:hypothetical protein
MGQTKFKYLNRVGCGIFWNNSWESINNYKKNFINFYFLDLFLNKFFNDNLFIKDYFYKKKNNQCINNKFFYKNILFLKKKYNFKKKIKNIKIFNSKIWILNYQNWVIIKVYVYVTKYGYINNVKKKKIIFSAKKYNKYLKKFDYL